MSKPLEPEETPGPASVPQQGRRWLSDRVAELVTATTAAVAALAGFVWALSPWLVFVGLAAGVVALVSADARDWLIARANSVGALIIGTEAGLPGFLYLEAPQVYTRERLVNDRFTQANWLREQLDLTGKRSFVESFASPSYASDEIQRIALSLSALAGTEVPSAEGAQDKGDASRASTPGEVLLDRLELFDKVNVYRGALRGELMDVQLDDGHDLDGNTLYRLNFNAVVAPFVDRRSYPGTAVFLIRAQKSDPEVSPDELKQDNKELLHQWQREMQALLTRVLEQRLEDFERQNALENPTDPKEDLALDWFMRTRLVRTFLDYLISFPRSVGPYLEAECPQEGPNWFNCRIDILARLAGFSYRTAHGTPTMQPAQAAGFQRAIELAHLVNIAQWPKAGRESYDLQCVYREEQKMSNIGKQAPSSASPEPPPDAEAHRPGTSATLLETEKLNPAVTEVAGFSADAPAAHRAKAAAPSEGIEAAAEVTDSAVPPETTAFVSDISRADENKGSPAAGPDPAAAESRGTLSGKSQNIDVIVSEKCLKPYVDPYRLRALARLLAVTDDLRTYSLMAEARRSAGAQRENVKEQPARQTKDDAGEAVAELLKEFGKVLPAMQPAQAEDETTVDDASDKLGTAGGSGEVDPDPGQFTIAALQAQMERIISDGSPLAELAQVCETSLEPDTDVLKATIDYAGCRFLYTPSTNMRGILAEFIVARVQGNLGHFYPETEPALKDFLTVTTDGCALTNCRIRVDLNGSDEKTLAKGLADALDDRTNGLSIYEISPRADAVVQHAHGSMDASVEVAGPQASASGGVSRQDWTAYADAVVIGFGQATTSAESKSEEATFGWMVRPQPRPDGGWSSSHHRLSAVISVPSWWKRLDLNLYACWIGPQVARAHGEALLVTPANMCEEVYGKKPDKPNATKPVDDSDGAQASGEKLPQADAPKSVKDSSASGENQPEADARNSSGAHYFMSSVRVQLPRSVDEVTARFNFDLVKAPYFDPAWKRDNAGASNALVAGRPAHIALAGERLWRGTVVTIDGQPADRITVLPDMKGVIAEFGCVRPSPGAANDINQWRARLTVWTAEGRTKPLDINILPFDAVQSADETPCYMQQTGVAAAQEVDPSINDETSSE